jgi:hypothetical protein
VISSTSACQSARPGRQQLNRDTTGERHHTSPIPDNRSNPLQVRSFLTCKALPLFGGQCQLINVNDPG